MNINVSFRHMDASNALRDHVTSKLERVCDKYVSGKVSAHVTLTVEKHRHIANFTLSIRNLTVRAVEKTEDMYSSIDLALDKIEKQLRRHKDRIRDHQPSNSEARKFRMEVLAPTEQNFEDYDEDEDFASDYEEYPAPESTGEAGEEKQTTVETSSGEVKVLKQGEFQSKTLSVQQAVLQLELLDDRTFYVFTEEKSGAICVVYKRNDGNVGLISTGDK